MVPRKGEKRRKIRLTALRSAAERSVVRGTFVRAQFLRVRVRGRIVGRNDARSGHSAALPFQEERIRRREAGRRGCVRTSECSAKLTPRRDAAPCQGVPENWPAPRSTFPDHVIARVEQHRADGTLGVFQQETPQPRVHDARNRSEISDRFRNERELVNWLNCSSAID